MTASFRPLMCLAASGAIALSACGAESAADAAGSEEAAGVDGDTVSGGSQAGTRADGALVTPPSWMPSEWDRDVYSGAGELTEADAIRMSRQNMIGTVPFTLWAVANDALVTEAFEPIWVWYTAIRSCERGIQMSEDLAGEFGNRQRGSAAIVQARRELKDWAATQPREMTLYFTARLGQWNAARGAFPLQELGKATTVEPKAVESIYRSFPFPDGATVELWSAAGEQSINHFQASLVAPQCVSPDGTRIYKFERMSQWWVVFGDADRGIGGQVNYRSREMLPPIRMTREAAAALAQRNPQRNVVVAVTFRPVGSSFVKGIDQSAIRARFRRVTVSDAQDGSVLVSKDY